MTDFFNHLFTKLSIIDSLVIFLFLLVAFLIGLLIGRLSVKRKWKRLQKEYKQLEAALITLQSEKAALQEKYTEQEIELQQQKAQVRQYQNDLQASREKIKNLQGQEQNIRNREATLLLQITQLKKEALENNPIQNPIESLPPVEDTSTLNRLDLIEKKMADLERENTQLQSAVDALQGGEEEIDVDIDLVEEDDFNADRDRSALAKVALKKFFGDKLPAANSDQKDHLQSINGIGPFIEQQLNDIGIYTFQQISHFDLEIIELVTDAIQFFPGRIARDNWQGQANQFLN